MQKFTLFEIIFCLFFSLSISSCTKDISGLVKNRPAPPAIQLEAAKVWRSQHLAPWPGQKLLKPRWDEAWSVTTYSKERMFVVSASSSPVQNPDVQILRFFFFTVTENSVVNGRIVEIIGHKYNLKENIDMLLKNYNGDVINNFNGSFLLYDINYNIIKSRTFKEGRIQKNTTTRMGTMSVDQYKKRMADTSIIRKSQ